MLATLVVVFTCCVAAAFGVPATVQQPENAAGNGRMVGGAPAQLGEFPWHVAIQSTSDGETWNKKCDGAIISEQFVITGYQCEIQAGETGRAVAGTLDWTTPGTVHYIIGTRTHTYIALHKVDSPFEFNGVVGPVRLPAQDAVTAPETVLAVSAWGEYRESRVLLKLASPVLSSDWCDKFFPGWDWNYLICAGDSDAATGLCSNGDFGAPLVLDGELRGVFFLQPKGCDYPGLYIRVSMYTDWIFSVAGVRKTKLN